VWKTEDTGKHWTSANKGLDGLFVRDLAIDPRQPKRVYAATQQGVFGTKDRGQTWHYLGPVQADTKIIKVDPNNSEILYAGVWEQGVFRSDNKGRAWNPVNEGLSDLRVRSFRIISEMEEIYVGMWGGDVFRSRDKGQHWTPIADGLGVARDVGYDPRNPKVLFLTTNNGIFKSYDAGQTWFTTGLYSLEVQDLASVGNENPTMFAGTKHGVFKMTDDNQWLSANKGLLSIDIRGVAATRASDGELYVLVEGGTLYKSDDRGQNWHSSGPSNSISTLTVDPKDTDRIIAGDAAGWLYLTSSGGDTWVKLWKAPSLPRSFAFDGRDPPGIYVGTDQHGVFKSTDYGVNWIPVNAGLEDPTVVDLAIDLSSPSVLYAATGQGVSKSTDGGTTWSTIGDNALGASIYSVALDVDKQIVWVASEHGVLRSSDKGKSWRVFDHGLPASRRYALSLDSSLNLYVGTQEGVYRLCSWWKVLFSRD
jgi:photosystem II stability/assembly factor-like uncharacterized protein